MPTYRSAREFIAAVAAKYRALTTYADVGVVRPIGAYEPLSCWFETQFARPQQQFRFQFIRPHPYRRLRHRLTKYIAGSDGSVSYFYMEERGSRPTVESEESLEMAVAGATGISQGTAHTIGELLLECVGGFSYSMLNRLRFRSHRTFDGVLCHRVAGRHPRGGRVVIWVGASDLLVRKVVKHRFGHEEVRFDIRADVPVASEVFRVPSPEPNPSIERTCPGKPGHAAHVER